MYKLLSLKADKRSDKEKKSLPCDIYKCEITEKSHFLFVNGYEKEYSTLRFNFM